jgi:hypothetical protein
MKGLASRKLCLMPQGTDFIWNEAERSRVRTLLKTKEPLMGEQL